MPFDFELVDAPFRMQPGLRKLAPGTPQLTPSRRGDAVVAAKLAVLSAHADAALIAEPGFDARPVVEALVAHASAEHPDALVRRGDALEAPFIGCAVGDQGRVHATDPALAACLTVLAPEQRIAGLLSLALAEDFALLDAATTRVPWLAVCLPSSWAPEHKVGRPFAEIHSPVADATAIVRAAPALARVVAQPQRLERFVWTLTPEPSLDRHPARVAAAEWSPAASPEELARRTFLRHERQTFIPLTERAQAIFTIRVEVEPLTHAVRSADAAARLHAALSTMSDAVLAYRGLAPARERLLAWLAARAGGASPAAPDAASKASPAVPGGSCGRARSTRG
ncbi:heme-dependent oxidative N-demethylase subunit alpha family protein [Piscinibacter koreensis]|uniref:DUF3445 domain-containing protein n=1 Tax=Piscinibacter koreensis TaxID=2742824 RepID=A0A7Y6NNF1_9BURK|nr:heme-dependent oxidative N-demethylase subunit alpha family protein [Schlegelella koreensis]NUZ06292.1 DUF3445 domain-containing protein [Schlegelella koreensis]